MFTEEEFRQFKNVLESYPFLDKINYRGFCLKNLSHAINFLVATRDFNDLENYQMNKRGMEFLPYEYLLDVKRKPLEEVYYSIRKNFIQNGYLYHITSIHNIDSILKNGILSLNSRFGNNLYEEAQGINALWNNISIRNNLKHDRPLIDIPDYEEIYKERFSSTYLSLDSLYAMLEYGKSGELMEYFVSDLLSVLGDSAQLNDKSKNNLRNRILILLIGQGYSIEQKEIDAILGFFDKYYQEYDIREKSIIMVPIKNVIGCNHNDYKNLLQIDYYELIKNGQYDIINEMCRLKSYHDIEYQNDISQNGLIAVSYQLKSRKHKIKKIKVKKLT